MFFVRMESVSIKQKHGIAKVIGSALGLTGALLCTFARGPAMYPESQRDNILHLTKQNYTKGDWVKGSLIILAANVAWCSWLIMQVPCFQLMRIHHLFVLANYICLVILFVRSLGTVDQAISGKTAAHGATMYVQLCIVGGLGSGQRKKHRSMETGMECQSAFCVLLCKETNCIDYIYLFLANINQLISQKYLFIYIGGDCDCNQLLVASLGSGEKGAGIHCRFQPFGAYHYCSFLSSTFPGDASLGKVSFNLLTLID